MGDTDGLRSDRLVGRDIELEIARDAGGPDDIGNEHLAVGEGGDVEPGSQGKGDPNRVGVGGRNAHIGLGCQVFFLPGKGVSVHAVSTFP